MDNIIQDLRRALEAAGSPAARESGKRFFKEEIRSYGVQTALVGRMAKEFYGRLGEPDKGAVFALCEELWRSGMLEESFIACDWAYRQRARFAPEDFVIFDRCVNRYVSNWASCDTLCNHTIGSFIETHPRFIEELKRWALSENRWARRAAAVSLIIPARKGLFLAEIFAIADLLLEDEDDLVRKGYGWMLKAASQARLEEVFDFVMARRDRMPRTALRYAIEKMPEAMRRRAMEKQKS